MILYLYFPYIFITNSVCWWLQVWRWRLSPRRESLNVMHFISFHDLHRFGCRDLVGSMFYWTFISAANPMDLYTKHLGVEIGKSFPCVQALADRRTLMIRLPNREFHGCGLCERRKLLVAGSSWIRVELIEHFLNRAVLFLTSGLRFRVLSLNP